MFATDTKQLMKLSINLENKSDDVRYEYLVYPFHSRSVDGMDVCIKKNLIATCSMDKSVKIWSYSNGQGFNNEINQTFSDEAFCVAFHPSGLQIVVGFADGIRMMNIFEDQLSPYKNISNIKNCREIVFSNGGHLFACQNNNNICVFKFYTAENPISYVFKKHNGLIRKIAWLQDDTGFVSIGWDSVLYFWKLDSQEPKWMFKKKNVEFTCVTTYKAEGPNETEPYVFVTGTDKCIREIRGCKKGDGPIAEGVVVRVLEQSMNLSQIMVMHNRRAIFTCVDEKDRPGSIQVIRGDMQVDKATQSKDVFEIQAHSLSVLRLKLSFDNSIIYSASSDGSMCVFGLADRDPKKKILNLPSINSSSEFLTPKMQRDKLQSEI